MANKPKQTSGSEILLEAHRLVNGPRQKDYGHPADDYQKVSDIFYSITGVDLSVSEENDTIHHDSLVDALGYLTCLNMAAQ